MANKDKVLVSHENREQELPFGVRPVPEQYDGWGRPDIGFQPVVPDLSIYNIVVVEFSRHWQKIHRFRLEDRSDPEITYYWEDHHPHRLVGLGIYGIHSRHLYDSSVQLIAGKVQRGEMGLEYVTIDETGTVQYYAIDELPEEDHWIFLDPINLLVPQWVLDYRARHQQVMRELGRNIWIETNEDHETKLVTNYGVESRWGTLQDFGTQQKRVPDDGKIRLCLPIDERAGRTPEDVYEDERILRLYIWLRNNRMSGDAITISAQDAATVLGGSRTFKIPADTPTDGASTPQLLLTNATSSTVSENEDGNPVEGGPVTMVKFTFDILDRPENPAPSWTPSRINAMLDTQPTRPAFGVVRLPQ